MKEEIETFRKDSLSQFEDDEPSCFNGIVRVVKYKYTVEEIEEPKEVIHQRLQELWDYSDNHHDHMPLEGCASEHGYKFKGQRGNKR